MSPFWKPWLKTSFCFYWLKAGSNIDSKHTAVYNNIDDDDDIICCTISLVNESCQEMGLDVGAAREEEEEELKDQQVHHCKL